jgi:hexosaminidase
MPNKSLYLIITIVLFSQNLLWAQHIIPQPVSVQMANGFLGFDSNLPVILDENDQEQMRLKTHVNDMFTSLNVTPVFSQNTNGPALKLINNKQANTKLGNEGYLLDIDATGISISANAFGGYFNALQTLKQLLPVKPTNKRITLPYISIEDYPSFGWRGLMLDVSRHFFSVEDVKKYIDQMVQYKFNVFHWHLTDDEGWRIEIKSLPKLTSVGAWRVERNGSFGEGRSFPKPGEKATYGGFYTHDQIRDVVAYAKERNVTIVPEIDMPGHCMAVLAAYPELSVGKTPKFVNPGSKFSEWYGDGTFKMLIENTLDPTNEKVYEFADKVMTEVASLFPGEYIHMGGDECYKGYWAESKDVQDFMKKNKIRDVHELQSYFVKRLEKIVKAKGKKLIGWDEILEGELPSDAAVMSWRGMKGGIEAAHKGHKVVMSPTTFAYLDYTQGDRSVETNIYADLSLEKCYQFDPVPTGVDPQYILGGQGNLWTEAIPHLDYAMYMTFPRALAISESVWSPASSKNWPNFVDRVEHHFNRFDDQPTTICKAIYDPVIHVKKKDDGTYLSLKSDIEGAEIRYSTDNTYPLDIAAIYNTEFRLPDGKYFLRAQLFRQGKPLGRMLSIPIDELVKRAK